MATTHKIIGIRRVNLGIVETDDVGAAGITNVALVLPVGTGEGVNYSSATVADPIRIMVDSELMHVTGRSGDDLTVIRAQEGTVAAAHTAGVNKVKRIRQVRFTFANAFNIDAQNQEITFQGDNTQEYVTLNLGMRGTMAADKFVTEVLEKIVGASPITSNIDPDEATRYYVEEGNYPNVAAEIDLVAIDDDTGLSGTIRIAVPKMQLYPRPWVPGNAATAAKLGMQLAWTALRTTTDLLGVTLPGLQAQSDGVFYWIAVLG